MPYKVVKIFADGKVEETIQPKAPEYKELRDFVGGLIQYVPHLTMYKDLTLGQMVMNEEGIILNLPFNAKATDIWLKNLVKGQFAYPPMLYGNAIYWAKVKLTKISS